MIADYETLRALCGTVGLLVFAGVFVVALVWTFRPGSRTYYQKMAETMLHEE